MTNDPGLEFGPTVRSFALGMRVFGRFMLVRSLGRGGMSVVWLARDEKLDLDVAVKFLPEAVGCDDGSVADLARETRRARELAHPHIVRVYDFHQDERLAGISMEFVDGGTLTTRRIRQPNTVFQPAQLIDWARQLCIGLTYAHEDARVVHRDLKPANLMIDGRERLKIADFGISASLCESVTRASSPVGSSGSPPYMSPQQMLGARPSTADDIYALGATLYELLTGKPPFYSGNIALQVQSVVAPSIEERRREFGISPGPISPAWEETIAACLKRIRETVRHRRAKWRGGWRTRSTMRPPCFRVRYRSSCLARRVQAHPVAGGAGAGASAAESGCGKARTWNRLPAADGAPAPGRLTGAGRRGTRRRSRRDGRAMLSKATTSLPPNRRPPNPSCRAAPGIKPFRRAATRGAGLAQPPVRWRLRRFYIVWHPWDQLAFLETPRRRPRRRTNPRRTTPVRNPVAAPASTRSFALTIDPADAPNLRVRIGDACGSQTRKRTRARAGSG